MSNAIIIEGFKLKQKMDIHARGGTNKLLISIHADPSSIHIQGWKRIIVETQMVDQQFGVTQPILVKDMITVNLLL